MSLRLALGIDAAWTATEPSGVALASETKDGWRLIRAASSYAEFHTLATGGPAPTRHLGESPDVARLLDDCRRLAGRTPDIVAVDMPLALAPIVGRRASDRAISSAFGAAKAATHSPSALRPGKLADAMRADFAAAGFALGVAPGFAKPALIEVYPHAALIALTGEPTRLPYKAGKTTIYWREVALEERRLRLNAVWRRLVAALDAEIAGVAEAIPPPELMPRGRALKAWEDRFDAAVCAFVGIAALEGRADAYGDSGSAIWVPRRRPPG